MLVHQILKSKPNQDVVTITPGSNVLDAAKMLAEYRIGTVVVSDDKKSVQGILSERDIVRELGKRGIAAMSDNVDALMTKNVVTCGAQDKVQDILTTMTEKRFRHMPVVDDGVLVGLVTIGDVVKAQLSEIAMEKEALQGMIMGH